MPEGNNYWPDGGSLREPYEIVEEWRPIPGYEGYEASNRGDIRRGEQVLRQHNGRGGYPAVRISGHAVHVHPLVCAAFNGPRPPGQVTRHLNGIRGDNRADNLAWGTTSENQYDAVRHGTHKNAAKTHCPQGHEYTPENTYVSSTTGHRHCAQCRRDATRKYYYETRRQKITKIGRKSGGAA